jgi:hypothetical protein
MLTKKSSMRLVTFVLDPPVVAILMFILVYAASPAYRNLGACLTGVFCLGFIPLSAWFYMVRHPGDYAGERKLGFIMSIAGYVIGTVVMLIFFRSSRQNLALMLSYLFTVIGLSLVNLLHYKASGHGAGIAGPATALTILYGWPGALTFLLLLVVGKAKVSIKEHSPAQMCVGAGIAVMATLVAFRIAGVLPC